MQKHYPRVFVARQRQQVGCAGVRGGSALSVIASLAFLSACGENGRTVTSPEAGKKVILTPALVTGDAAAALGGDGNFVLAPAVVEGARIVSESEAREFATSWARQFGAFHRSRLERLHGDRIDIAALQPCGRAFLAKSPYEPLTGEVPNYTRNLFGPYWIVGLCGSAGTPQVALAIAASATGMRLEGGQIRFPLWHGNEFISEGVPRGLAAFLSPEEAAHTVATAFGRKVTAVPDLILAGHKTTPHLARWRVTLDGPVDVGRDPRVKEPTASLFIGQQIRGPRAAIFAAIPGEPAIEYRYRLPRINRDDPVLYASTVIRLRPGMPQALVPVTVQKER
jgi:hypothetical protein